MATNLTNVDTEIAGNMSTIVLDMQASYEETNPGGLCPEAHALWGLIGGTCTASSVSNGVLTLTVSDPGRLGLVDWLNQPRINGMLGAAISGRCGVSFRRLAVVPA